MGSTANTSVWADADVYIAPVGTAIPADVDTAFGVAWTLVGLLDGSAGFEYGRTEDKKDFFAWGGILCKTTRKNHKSTYKFVPIEDNVAVRSLMWPGSTAGVISVPQVGNIMIAFETTSGGKRKRLISRNFAQVDLDGTVKDSEDDLTKVPLIATIFPDDSKVLFDRQYVPDIASIAITPLTLALSLAGANIKPLVATATYDDATTGDVTDQVTWLTSAAAKATVAHGYVTGVATGTANVSCTFDGITSTAPCVVTVSS